jgi:SAM-dependent methyltransferase
VASREPDPFFGVKIEVRSKLPTANKNTSDSLIRIMDRLACPKCAIKLNWRVSYLYCNSCSVSYPVDKGIIDLREGISHDDKGINQWNEHWDRSKQQTLSQRFFSFYRKAVFARTIRYFVNRYFDPTGVFVEAGSGTSETSSKINKLGTQRTLVALDAIFSVLEECHPIMDVRVCANIFHLPFREDSIDGIWNVGVMEHFTHEQIDQIMREFHRVLKQKGIIILLWPAADSIPQKLLRFAESIINKKKHEKGFRFHPPEISLLRSTREGHDVLRRNGFKVSHIDFGFRSLMAFKTIIGEKNEKGQCCYSGKG